nr:ATP synthase F1 subunit epsilon [Nitritalea halalkaliphila]
MQLEIVTPDKKIFEGQVTEATFPGANGSFQVLQNHAAIVSALAKGVVAYSGPAGKASMVVDGGVVEVKDNKIVLLVEKVLS